MLLVPVLVVMLPGPLLVVVLLVVMLLLGLFSLPPFCWE